MRVRVSNEMAIVLLLVLTAILFSVVVMIRENPWLVPLSVAGIVLYRKRRTLVR
jgi:4-hydroxybenzoate polyprenyltransferase